MRRLPLAAAALLTVLVTATGCGGTRHHASASGSPSTAGSFDRFASCLRQHGQDVPDQDPNSGETSLVPPAGGDQAAWRTAVRACQQYLPNGGQPAAPDPQELAALRAYAKCMRAHGIELSDPDPNTGKSQYQGRLANASRDQIQNDPGVQAADAACHDKLNPTSASQKPGGTK